MASFPNLRPRARLATAERRAARAPRKPALLISSAVFLTLAFYAVSELATLRGTKADARTPAFLTRALGSPDSNAPFVRTPAQGHATAGSRLIRPALGGALEIANGALKVRSGRARVALRFGPSASRTWRRYDNGISRATSFGRETIAFGVQQVEESLTVDRHVGARVWRWQLDTRNAAPTVAADGSVRLDANGADAGLRILPVTVLDRNGKNVTPAGARWSVARNGKTRWLELRLDDSKLPLPYVIDPIALVAACPGGGCATATASATTLVTVSRPASVVTGNLMIAQVTIRNNSAITAPLGWSTLGNLRTSGTGLEQALYYRVATVADTSLSTYQWSWIGSVDATAGILAYSGTDATTPFDVTPSDNSGTGTSAIATGLTTTQANDMLVAFYGAQGQSGPTITLDQDAGQGLTQEYAVTSGSSPVSKARGTAADGIQAAAGATGNKTATASASTPWVAHLVALMPPLSADGTGTLTTPTTAVSASQTGNTLTFTYTAGANGMQGGAVTLAVPTGWTAPSTAAANAGYTTASTGTVSVGGQTITVSNVTLAGGATMTITYGNTSGGGPGATATGTTGVQTWQAQEKSRSTGTLTNLGASPSITVYAANGSGTLTTPTSAVSAGQTGRTLTFTYTAAAGGVSGGAVTVAVPAGWSAPSTAAANAGYTTASTGTVSVAAQTITVSNVTLAGGATMTITYGDTSGGGPGATATATTGAQTWQAQEKSTSGGTLANLASSPSVTVYAADGSGTLTSGTAAVSASSTGNTITFTYTAATGGISNGTVTLAVPAGWSAPSTSNVAAGYTTSSAGTVSVAGQTITVSSLTLAGGATATITYGNKNGGTAPGATAPASTGAQTWQAQEKSTSGGTLANLASSPSITVSAADGGGTLTTPTTDVSASQTGNTLVFTYTAPAGGLSGGSVTVAVPAGWSAPSTSNVAAGYTTASAGTVSVAGQTITVSSLTLAAGNTVTITYGNKNGGTAPGATASSSTGAQTWQAQEKSTSGGTLTNLASSPSITVDAADGSGTLTTPTTNVSAGQTGRTLSFTYTAATGGIASGSVTVAVPAGWTAPSTTASSGGYTTASAGTVSVAGQTITVSSLTLSGGSTLTITYGDTSGGGPGATATGTTGAQTWQAQEKSTSGGTLANLPSSPSVTVDAADGSGTLTTPTTNVSAGQTGRTLTFTYTAATGGIASGSVTLAVPAGWSAPSTSSAAAGYTTSSAGTVSVAGQTITVSSLTLAAGNTVTITYGNTSGGGPGATASGSTGAQTWQAQEKSTSGGTLTNLASSPSVTVNAADGSGTLTTPTSAVAVGSTANTITFTYTAAAGGLSNGAVTVAVPAGWSAPSTTGSSAGYTTASAGTVSVAGQTITVSSLTLAGGATVTITYGDRSGGGPGATAPSTSGAQTWQAQEKSTSGGTLTNLASSPGVTVLAADGSGTLTTPTASVNSTSTGNTITFTYTAAAGGLANGTVTVVVPAGWSAPSTTGSSAGYTTASAGTVSVAGQTITISSLTVSGGGTFTITYGATGSGGPGATAPTPAGAQTWTTQERSSAGGTLTGIASSPSITVNDTTAPSAPALSFGSFTNASVTGTTVYIRQGTAGGFTVTGTSSDPESGIDHLTFASGLGSGWTGGGADSTAPYTAAYTFGAGSTAPAGNQNVTATNGWSLTSAATPFTVAADTTAPSVTPPSVTAGYYTSLSVPVTPNGGTDAGSGVNASSSTIQRDVATLSNGTCGSFSGSWTTITLVAGFDTGVASGHCYEYRELLSDNVGNQGQSAASNVADVDTQAPGNAISVTNVAPAGSVVASGTTVYYRGSAVGGGSFKLTNAVSDAESGPASSTTAALAGTTTGWTHTPSTVTTPAGGPYTSNTFTWAQGTTSSPTETVTAADTAGNTTTAPTLTLTNDSTAPSVTAPTVTAGYVTTTSVPVTLNTGSATDGGSGVDPTTSVLQRDSATLANGTCGAFSGTWTTVTLSGGNDTTVANGACYEYRQLLSDKVGNQGQSAPSNVVEVDAQGPTNSLSLSNVSPAGSAFKSGSTVYYRGSAVGGGSFKLTNAVSDAESGPASSTTAALAGTTTGWTHTPSTVTTPAGGPYTSNTFTWAQGTTSSPTETVTAADTAGNTTTAPTLTLTNDSTAPTGGALTVNGVAASAGGTSSTSTTGSFPIDARTDYAEAQSGSASGLASSTLTRASATLANNACGSFGAATTVVGSPAQTLPTGCYLFTLTGTDNVGNTVSVSTTVTVDTSAPSAPTLGLANPAGSIVTTGTNAWFLPSSTGSIDVNASSTDADSGISGYTFPSAAAMGSGWSVSGSGATRTYSFGAGAASPGTQSVTATNNVGGTASSSFTISADSTPPTTTIQCNAAACLNGTYYTSSPVHVTLQANDGAGSGVQVIRYTTDGSTPTLANGSDYTGTIDVSTTTTIEFRSYDRLGNAESVGSQTILLDGTPPTGPALTLSENPASGAQSVSGTTLYYRPGGSGTFRVSAATSDPETGVASVAFPAVPTVTGGGTLTSAPYQEDYSWNGSTTDAGSHGVVATNGAGATSTAQFTLTPDSTAPSGQTVTLTGANAPYYGSASVTFSLGDGTDGGSGIDTSSRTVTRESAPLAADTCGTFTADPGTYSSPDTSVSGGHCYRYSFTIADNVGNVSAPVTATAKVDTAAPTVSATAPAVVSGGANQAWDGPTKTLFFRPSASGSFTLGATASDATTAVAGVDFPDVSAVGGWSGSTGGTDTSSPYGSPATYSWSSGAAQPGPVSIIARDDAGNSATDTVTLAADGTAPSGQAITLTGANAPWYTSTSVTFALADGTDNGGGSGVDTTSRVVTRESAVLAGGTCGSFSPDPGTYSSPDTSVSAGHCYRYTFVESDKVGNVSAGATAVAKVATSAPTVSTDPPTALTGAGNQSYDAPSQTLWFRPSGSGSFALNATASDGVSGISGVVFPDVSGVSGWSGSTGGTDTTSPYSSQADYTWTAGASAPGARTIVAQNGAGLTSTSPITLAADSTAPTGQTISLTGANAPYYGTASVTFTLGDGTDAQSGLDTTARTVTRQSSPLSGDTCGTFAADPGTYTSPDTSVASGHCYRYSFTIADKVGNVSAPVSATARVDTAAPTVSVTAPSALTGAGNQSYDAPSKTLFFRSTGSGSFTLNANASDVETAVANVAFPDVSGTAGWSTSGGSDTTSPYASPTAYAWSAGAAQPGAQVVTATDKAGNSATDTIMLKDDTAAPTGQTITLTGAGAPYYGSTSVTFSLADGTDPAGGSGLDTSSRTVTRESAALAGDTCGSFASDPGTFTSPDTSVTTGHCYRYTFVESDKVGNVSAGASVVAKVDTSGPAVTLTDPGSPIGGMQTLSATASDAETGVAQVVFQESPAGAGTWTTIGTDTTAPYSASWDTTGVADGSYDLRAVATNSAGATSSSVVASRTVDNTPPDTTLTTTPPNPDNDQTPTFAFTSTETGSTFACRVDSGSWTACTSPDTLGTLPAGSHTFDVRATDAAGNTDPTPASYTWTIDLTVPDTTIDASPPNPSNDVNPTFQFSSTQPGSTFECRIDGGSWAACTSPDTLGTLVAGSHTFDVRARSSAGSLDPSPASYTWTIDLTPPSVTITAPTQYINASDPTSYPVTATTPDSDVARIDFYECSDASTGCSTGTWTQFGTDGTAPYGATWTTPAFDGPKAIRAVAVDQAGNTGADVRTITIDRTPPSGTSIAYPAGYATGPVTITTGNGPDPDVKPSTGTIERQTATLANGSCGAFGGWSTVTSPDTVPSGACAVYRYSVADNAGNVAVATSGNVVESDTSAPTSTIADPGTNLRQTVTLSATASDTGGSGIASVSFERRPSGGGGWTTIGSDSTAPYSTSFDTTTVADGLYDFRAVATDGAGNVEAAPTVVSSRRIDNTPPSATMTSPGNPVRGTVTLTSATSDGGSGIATVAYEIAPHGGSFSSQPSSWDTTAVTDGLYDLRVVATDVAGNSTTSAPIMTRVDNTPPSLTFSSPATGSIVSGTIALTASATDASPASPPVSFELKPHAASVGAYAPVSSPWDTTGVADGLYDIRATATDDAGNQTQVVHTSIEVDNTPPTVSITAPPTAVNGSFPSPTPFSANASDAGSGVANVQFFDCSDQSTNCSTGTWNSLGTVTSAPYTVSWNVPANGNKAIRAVATDNAGHTASAIRNVVVDTTPPVTAITGKPADPSKGPATFTFTSNEPGSTFECRIDGGAWTPCTSPKTYTGLADNAHTFDVRATDPAGNVDPNPDSWTWHIDTTPPSGIMDDPGRNVRGLVTLTSSGNDPLSNGYASGIASVAYQYSADGITWATVGTNTAPPFGTMSFDTTGVSDGVYQLRVVVTDVAGNSTTSTPVTNVRIDNTPPATSQNDPGAFLRGTKTLTGSASDSGSGVDHVDFQVAPAGTGSWVTVGTATTAPYSASFDTTTAPDGHYDFRTVATDVAGNQAASTPVTSRLVDNTPPTATMTSPGPYVRGTISLSSTTSDPGGANASGIASVAYEYSTDGGATWTPTGSSLDTKTLPDGSLKLQVVATDNAGNATTSAPVTTLVDNTKPVTTDNAPSGWQSSPVTVTLSATDAGSGVNVTEYSVDGGPFTVGTSVTIPAPADGSNDGAHTIAYFSSDNAGNIEQTKSTQVLIDASPPTCPSCTAADYLRGTVTLSASPVDSGAGIQSVEFDYSPSGSGTWTTIGTDTTGPAPYTQAWDTTTVADGQYDLRIIVTDNAGNTTTTDLPGKVVDNTPPNVATVGAPTAGSIVSGNVTISASAADATSPIASVQFFAGGSSIGTITSAPYTLNWDSTTVADGPVQLYVVVTDMAGNTRQSATQTITVDNHAPTPTLANPGQNLSGTVTLTATSDPDTTQVNFERRPAGGSTWTSFATATSAPFSASLDTTTLPDGLYDFRVVATDGTGNTGTSPVRSGVRIDNTPPSGSLTAPAAGATVGGPSVQLSVSASDSGSGVASVRYDERPTGSGSFSPITTSSSAPFGATWDTTGFASGDYDLRPVITDAAGNSFTGATVTVHVDTSAPTVVLSNPGASLSGTVSLAATVTGSGATQVAFSVSPAGANSWQPIATDTTSPYGISFDTTKLADGSYDLRAVVSDSVGNTSSSIVPGVDIDNLPPRLVSSTPADGSHQTSVSSITLDVSEPATPQNVTLDGASTVAPVITGTHISYGTGALGPGLHTLVGTLRDATGKTAPFVLSFTVWNGSGTPPPTQAGSGSCATSTTVTSADGFATVTIPGGACSSTTGDWIIVRITPSAAAPAWNGFAPGTEVVDVSAHWALSGQPVHHFDLPISIVLHATGAQLVAATRDTGDWRVMPKVPVPGVLPTGWQDGQYADTAGFHILTLHLSEFTALKDIQPPAPPSHVRGFLFGGGLTLTWTPGADNSGTYDYVTVSAGGTSLGTFGNDRTGGDVGPWSPSASGTISLTETDLSGNVSAATNLLEPVPELAGLGLQEAEAALVSAGFKVGTITEGGTGAPGTVTGPNNLVLAEAGDAIDLTVAPGTIGATKLVLDVVGAKAFKPANRHVFAARIQLTRRAVVTGTLYSPRGTKLLTWRRTLKAGATIVKIRIPRQLRRPGRYAFRWTARSGADSATRTLVVRAVRRTGRIFPRGQRMDVVLVGTALPRALPIAWNHRQPHVVAASGIDPAFRLAGNRARNVQVVVVNVDQYGLQFLRDLHTVFPAVKIVAVSHSPKTLRAARRAGARVGLSSAAPTATLSAVVGRLLVR